MNRRITPFAALLLVIIYGAFSSGAPAQTITGRISGTVTDASGAAVPGVTVKIINEATQQPRSATTDPNGFYVATNLPVGNYSVTIEHRGFKKTTKTGYNLVADGRLTVDFALEAGEVTETVEVVASTGETVNSTSGEVARVIDRSQVQELALNGRNYLQLTTLIPGAPLLTDDPLALMTDLGVNQPINGNRGNTNLLTVDGGFNLDSGSNNSQINNVGIDFIQEVKVQTSNFSSEYGRNSGASINVVTRSGGNQFHGSVFEFLRNDKLDANNFFNKARAVEIPKPSLRYNNFGWSFGGPIIKDKFFFFGGMEWKKIRRFTASTGRSIPTRADRNGDFSFRLRGPDGIVGTADDGVLRDPSKALNTCTAPVINSSGVITTAAVRTGCFPGNIIPANLITADGKALANIYTAMEGRAVSYVDTPTGNNAVYQEPNPFNVRQDIIRLDYRFNERHSIYGRYLHDDYVLIAPFGTFIDSQLPTIPTERRRPSPSYQIGHTWMVTPNLINEAKINASWNGQRIPPVGDAWKRSTYGLNYQQLFAGGGRFEESIPNVTVSGFASFNGANASLLSPTTDIAFSDNLSWVRGAHTLKTGAQIIRNRKDQNGRSIYTGTLSFNTDGNPNTTRNGFADALLGNFRNYSEASIDPIGFFRFSQTEAYVNDSWRLNRKLNLELGVRYAYSSPTYTQANNIVNFDPALYDPAKAVTVITVNNTAVIDLSKGGNRYNGLIIAGAGVPQDELGRIPNGNDPALQVVPTGAPRGLYDTQNLFMPRVGFAYSPTGDNKTAIRGGFGIFYDKPEGNIIFSSVNIPPFTDSAQFENGNLSNIRGAAASAVAPFGEIQTIDPNLVLPYVMSYSLSVQRELPWGIFGEVAYVGNQARHLLRQPDINQPTFEALRANAALPSAQRASTNALRPYKGYSSIRMRLSDSTANYNSLQVYAAKRKGDLTMTASYTWSKALADTSGNGDNPEDPFNRSYNYGPTSFDRRHIFVTTYTYRLPFFRKSNGLLNNTLGGWELSGITRWQTGQNLTPTGNSSIGGRRADATGLDVEGPRTLDMWFNKAAFVNPQNDRRGSAGVGVIEGPGRHLWDLSLRKRFAFTEKVGLQFQGDFFNAWNIVNLNNPNVDANSGDYGKINGAAPARNIQLGLKLTF
jgi:hypothetical protein